MISPEIRQRANFSCEYCGVSETDPGSQLTIDHFRPITIGGDDQLDNLLYCSLGSPNLREERKNSKIGS